jgi:nicotinic acid mononucleotide adenylyltransferase
MGNIFDNFLKKLCTPQSTVPNYVKRAISWKNWNSLKSQLQEYKNKRNQTKYNNMRENFTVIFNNIFVPIDSTLRSQNVTPNIKCNRQTFNNVNDAIQSMDIFKI